MRRKVAYRGLVLVCAFALCGCGSAPGQDGGARQPAATIERADFQVTYRLEGVTRDGPMVGVLPNPQLALKSAVPKDSAVAQGQILGEAEVDPRIRARLGGPGDVDNSRLAQLESMGGRVEAPVDGVFAERDGVPVVLADGIDVVIELTPVQQLRSRSLRFTGQAVVETVVGVRQVPCAAVWTQRGTVQGDEPAPARLHCRLPNAVETAAGLRAQVILASQRISDAIVVLNIYIGYDMARDGYFLTVRGPDGARRIPVDVGATDGVKRVILSEVPIGAELVRPPEGGGGVG